MRWWRKQERNYRLKIFGPASRPEGWEDITDADRLRYVIFDADCETAIALQTLTGQDLPLDFMQPSGITFRIERV